MPLRLEELTVGYENRILIEGLSWDFPPFSMTAVTGPSGSGKSSLFGVIAGLSKPRSGSVRYDGIDQQDVALISQVPVNLSQRSVRDNVAVGALARGASYRESCEVAEGLLEELGLAELMDTVAHRTSGGERQRVAIARMIARRSPVLLADEPTASLDAQSRAAVVRTLNLAAQRGAIVLVATHDDFVARACGAQLSPWTS